MKTRRLVKPGHAQPLSVPYGFCWPSRLFYWQRSLFTRITRCVRSTTYLQQCRLHADRGACRLRDTVSLSTETVRKIGSRDLQRCNATPDVVGQNWRWQFISSCGVELIELVELVNGKPTIIRDGTALFSGGGAAPVGSAPAYCVAAFIGNTTPTDGVAALIGLRCNDRRCSRRSHRLRRWLRR